MENTRTHWHVGCACVYVLTVFPCRPRSNASEICCLRCTPGRELLLPVPGRGAL
ncbi:hypothetical protein L210DRAFT_3533798, partial [Boletus edulis BED1]